MQSKNADGPGNCTQISVMVTAAAAAGETLLYHNAQTAGR